MITLHSPVHAWLPLEPRKTIVHSWFRITRAVPKTSTLQGILCPVGKYGCGILLLGQITLASAILIGVQASYRCFSLITHCLLLSDVNWIDIAFSSEIWAATYRCDEAMNSLKCWVSLPLFGLHLPLAGFCSKRATVYYGPITYSHVIGFDAGVVHAPPNKGWTGPSLWADPHRRVLMTPTLSLEPIKGRQKLKDAWRRITKTLETREKVHRGDGEVQSEYRNPLFLSCFYSQYQKTGVEETHEVFWQHPRSLLCFVSFFEESIPFDRTRFSSVLV